MKKYIIIGIIVLIYISLCFILFGFDNNKDNTKKQSNNKKTEEKIKYVIFHDNVVLQQNKDSFIKVKNNEYNKELLYAFENGKYLGNYYYRFVETKKYLYDEEYNPISFNGKLLLNNYDSNMSICNMNEQQLDDNDISVANKILKQYNKVYNSNSMKITKYKCDIDQDKKLDSIYSLEIEDDYLDSYYSIAYVSINDKIINISTTTDTVLLEIADFNSDGLLELIIAEIVNNKTCYKVLKYNDNKFKNLTNC